MARDAMDHVTAAAERCLAEGSPATCLALLPEVPSPYRQQLQALCHIAVASSKASSSITGWCKLFGLDAATASPADVRRQYKRLATLVHPDKCRLAGAADGFRRLRTGTDLVIASLQLQAAEPPNGDGGPQAKRARRAGGASSGGGAAAWGAGSWELPEELSDGEEDDGWVADGGGFPWWEEWDRPPVARPAAAAGAGGGGGQQEGQPARGTEGQPAATTASAAASGVEERGQEKQGALESMSLDELRAEVRRRQATLLLPQVDAEGQRIPLPQLQAGLRRARSVLSERAAANAAASAAAHGGGFLP